MIFDLKVCGDRRNDADGWSRKIRARPPRNFIEGYLSSTVFIPLHAINMSSPPLPRSIVKATHGQEVRRFVVQSKSYEVIYAQIAELFDIPTDSFVLKFHDDEGDLCSITSDLELDYAISNEFKIIVVGVSSEHAPNFSTGAVPAPEAASPSPTDASQPEYVFKISCGDQVRRLATRSHSYETFYASIARAFDMPTDSFVLQFHVRYFSRAH